jgi:predicted transposase YbfD/YdcC
MQFGASVKVAGFACTANEISAAPELPDLMALEDCMVTIDAKICDTSLTALAKWAFARCLMTMGATRQMERVISCETSGQEDTIAANLRLLTLQHIGI